MGVTNTNKVVSTDRIACDGSLQVTLSVTAAPDIISNPTDIALVLDRSGSMAGAPLANLKLGAKAFLDILSEATGGAADGQIGAGSRIGVVSFANSAREDTGLITSTDSLKAAIDALLAGGSTNHADAFLKATALLDTGNDSAKVIVLFTDGNTTTGQPPAPLAQAARDKGILIYCIGLVGADGLNVDTLNEWATPPAATHVSVTPDAGDLEDLFAELAANLAKTGATEIVIEDVVNADFEITSLAQPSKGTAITLSPTALRWKIDALGVTGSESAQLSFFVRHVGLTDGTKPVNESISYTDKEGNLVRFPDPTVEVSCDVVTYPEPCPEPVDFSAQSCQDAVVVDLGQTGLSSQGRILQLDVTLKDVCPETRVALAVILTETDADGLEHQRGTKTMVIPAHQAPVCRDVVVKCIKFVVPDALLEEEGTSAALCSPRKFSARLIAHSIDSSYRCCEALDQDPLSPPYAQKHPERQRTLRSGCFLVYQFFCRAW